MKKQILIMAIIVGTSMTSAYAYAQVNKKSEKARKEVKQANYDLKEANKDVKEANKDMKEANENLVDANKDLLEASIDSTAEYLTFKKDAETSIANNKRTITALREKKWSVEDDKAMKQYGKKIEALEHKNNELQKSINMPSNAKSRRWEAFKREFKHDMNELGEALRDLAVNNTK